MARRPSSSRWLQRQKADRYVRDRAAGGFRSRAAYKLQELDRRDRLLGQGMRVIDLGASPGGWTQVATQALGATGTVIAIDVLEMEPVAGSIFVHGDCRDADVMDKVRVHLGDRAADLVMSDMAPNITGVAATDQAACEDLALMSLEFAREFLAPGGAIVMKLFQFAGTEAIFHDIKRLFRQTWRRKPPASRSESREFYVVAKGYGI